MSVSRGRRHDLLDWLADQGAVLVAEESVERTVRGGDTTDIINENETVRGGLPQRMILEFSLGIGHKSIMASGVIDRSCGARCRCWFEVVCGVGHVIQFCWVEAIVDLAVGGRKGTTSLDGSEHREEDELTFVPTKVRQSDMTAHATTRIILASPGTEGHTPGALLTAAVLADWFAVPLTLVTDTEDRRTHLEALAQTLGTETETTRCYSSRFAEQLMAFAHESRPSIIVGDPTDALVDVASRSTQTTLLVGAGRRPRLPTGPLVLDGPLGVDDLETLALVAAWSIALAQPVQIVQEIGRGDEHAVQDDQHRLSELGVTVGIDRVQTQSDSAAIAVCRTRRALALAIPNRRLVNDATVGLALESGINVLVAASPDPERAPSPSLATALHEPTPKPREKPLPIEHLDPLECMTYLQSRRVGRLGFIDGGWPVVLPINYRVTDDGAIVFKSVVGSKTAAADRSSMVCFEVDDIDGAGRPMWSVVAQGELSVAHNPEELHTAWRHDPEPWIEGEEWTWLRLRPLSVSGRRIAVDSGSAHSD